MGDHVFETGQVLKNLTGLSVKNLNFIKTFDLDN